MLQRALAAALLALALAGCGGTAGGGGEAGAEPAAPAAAAAGTAPDAAGGEAARPEAAGAAGKAAELWVTRDRGAEAILTAEVPAGLTVLQALDRVAEIETRYGGRFVQAIEGIEGSLEGQRDWFYFLNGIEPDVGAAEVRLRPGDVAWWDYRSWASEQQVPVVVGAFPEPFLHGFGGRRRPVEVRHPPELADAAEALAELLDVAGGEGEPNVFALEPGGEGDGATLVAARAQANDSPVTFTLAGELEAVRAAALALARDPAIVRYRYTARFGPDGRLIE